MTDNPNYRLIDEYVEELKEKYPNKMSDFELLTIAVKMQKNDILAGAFKVSPGDDHPSALEAIAIQLGQKPSIQ